MFGLNGQSLKLQSSKNQYVTTNNRYHGHRINITSYEVDRYEVRAFFISKNVILFVRGKCFYKQVRISHNYITVTNENLLIFIINTFSQSSLITRPAALSKFIVSNIRIFYRSKPALKCRCVNLLLSTFIELILLIITHLRMFNNFQLFIITRLILF